ncbi:MAG: UvrB/UvrC motif-containing protein [Tepidisphaeraceae bacterium]
MDDRLTKLQEKARALPKAPGVYLMKDAKGVVVYIGKSASLRDRVSSYFQPSTKLEHKKVGMVDEIVDFDILQTESEVEALLAENRLIKDIQPKFNARLLDDKTFPYLMVTMGDDYPGVFVTRVPQERNARVFGPFTSVWALKEAVTLMQKAFKYRTCHLEILEEDPKKRFFRPCLLYSIGQCTAPCADKISKADYRADINRFLRFLDGNREQILRDLHKEMIEASRDMQFERAAKIRDEIKALQSLGQRAAKGEAEFWQPEAFVSNPQEGVEALRSALEMEHAPRVIEGIDIAHLQGGEMVGSLVCFIDGVPFKQGYKRFKIKHGQGNNDYLSIQEVVTRRYREASSGNELYPDVILIDGGLGQLHAALDAFKLMDVKPPMVISLAKKEELVYVQAKAEPIRLARNHLGLKLLQYTRDEAHRFAQHYHHILRRKAQLEEDVKQGKRPPAKRRKKSESENPWSTIPSLPTRAERPGEVNPTAKAQAADETGRMEETLPAEGLAHDIDDPSVDPTEPDALPPYD